MSVCEFQGLFSLLPSPSGTHNHTQIYNAVNTMLLETKLNRGGSNRFFSCRALGSFFGKYFCNRAIFHGILSNDVHTMQLRAHKRIIEKVHCVLGKILISLCIFFFCQRKVDSNITNQTLKNNTPNFRHSVQKDHFPSSITFNHEK